MQLKINLAALLTQPPRIVAQKILRLFRRQWQSKVVQNLDFLMATYGRNFSQSPAPLETYLKKPPLDVLNIDADRILSLAELYLDHHFDLLGSGWVQVRHGMVCRGLKGYRYSMGPPAPPDFSGHCLKKTINGSNRIASQKIWELIPDDYHPIDWQLDFKSGYRWQEKKPSSFCKPAPRPGVDIKVPWELSRMQHLPQLALACGLASHTGHETRPPQAYRDEFRNQVLDFIATNPPRFGVNWHCPMDVGIRVANWLVAYDLFRAEGASFDSKFEQAFKNSVYDHGCHILQNLEWNPTLRSNHYLANIAGLLFVSAYLPRSQETDTWLAFSIQELIHAMEDQFQTDGSNFEASTSYHRLSAEMMLYGTALILGLPESKLEALKDYTPIVLRWGPKLQKAPMPFYPVPGGDRTSPLPPAYFEKLGRMADFTRAVLKPNGQVAQIGDNDSGRFFKLQPKLHPAHLNEIQALYSNLSDYPGTGRTAPYWVEDHLDHSHLAAGIDSLLGKSTGASQGCSLEEKILVDLAGGTPLSLPPADSPASGASIHSHEQELNWEKYCRIIDEFPSTQCQTYEIPAPESSLLAGMHHASFPDFGLYLMVSQRMFLSIRCGPVGQKGNGGHAHNDALSIELQIDRIDRIADPGSFLYTPLPEIRNAYRSVKAHFAPRVGEEEPNPIDRNLFQMEDRAQAQCLYFGNKGFIGMHRGYGDPVYRMIRVEDKQLVIKDAIDGPGPLVRLEPLDPTHGLPFSSGYGMRYY